MKESDFPELFLFIKFATTIGYTKEFGSMIFIKNGINNSTPEFINNFNIYNKYLYKFTLEIKQFIVRVVISPNNGNYFLIFKQENNLNQHWGSLNDENFFACVPGSYLNIRKKYFAYGARVIDEHQAESNYDEFLRFLFSEYPESLYHIDLLAPTRM